MPPKKAAKRSRDEGEENGASSVGSAAQTTPASAGARSWTNAPKDVQVSAGAASWGALTDSLIFRNAGTAGQLKSLPASTQLRVAAFDMDDALIYPKTGKTFPKSADDWQWLIATSSDNTDVPTMLKKIAQSYHFIIIYSNQEKIGKDAAYGASIKKKIDTLAKELGPTVPLYAMCATHKDGCRKPAACGWEAFSAWVHANTGGKKIDMTLSFYCGDAAGRTITTLAGRGKDFSCSDRKFAYNAKLQFYTPEELYLAKDPAPFSWGAGMTPELVDKIKAQAKTVTKPAGLDQFKGGKDIVLMCGPPGCGKSTFYHTYLKSKGYKWINQDTLKTKAKVEKAVTEGLASGETLCVDKTNPSAVDRKWFIDAAKKKGYTIRCVHLDVDSDLVDHMNVLRGALPDELKHSGRVPDVAKHMFTKAFVAPKEKEGFTSVLTVPFTPSFPDPRLEECFFWLS